MTNSGKNIENQRSKDDIDLSGVITGVNHLVLLTDDMEKTMEFYCGLLGMKVRATVLPSVPYQSGSWREQDGGSADIDRLYFIGFPDSSLLVFAEKKGFVPHKHLSTFDVFPIKRETFTTEQQKLDHLAFNVKSAKELEVIQKRLRDAGYDCTPVQKLEGPPFVCSIYSHDPNGLAIEFSTFDLQNVERWASLAGSPWYLDPDPVASFRGFQDLHVGDFKD